MRHIAVFNQRETDYAVGFDNQYDAVDFLYWGYEEYDLLPYGIFDVITGEVWSYEHRGERLVGIDEPDIRQVALNYLRSATRQAS